MPSQPLAYSFHISFLAFYKNKSLAASTKMNTAKMKSLRFSCYWLVYNVSGSRYLPKVSRLPGGKMSIASSKVMETHGWN